MPGFFFKNGEVIKISRRGARAKTIYMQVKSLVDLARRYDSGGKRDDPKDVRDVSIYCHNSYEKVRSVGICFARWLAAERGTPVFQMVTITESDVDRYVKSRLEHYKEGKITSATLQTELSALKKIEKLVNKRYGKVDWGIPEERGQRRLSKDLGHNRLDVTFAYVPRKK